MSGDAHWMRLALAEARRGTGLTSPNPCVGAVIVKDGRLLGSGWHRKAGGPHAEVEALRNAEEAQGLNALAGATAYVTLEPCSTHGRTPPCVEALIAAGIRRVVWGADDPNPKHAGQARGILSAEEIEVASGVLEEECREVIAPFAKLITTGLPWVIAKAGMSLDGRITRPEGEGQWITSEVSRADAMGLRVQCDAILVGAETLRRDNPSLTLRGPDIPAEKEQPWRVILTHSGNLPPDSKVFTDEHSHRTLAMRSKPLPEVLQDLAARGVMCVLIEGGGRLLASAFSGRLVDEAVFYTAPVISGTGRPVVEADCFEEGSVTMQFTSVQRIGPDVKLRARIL
ncbi:MAG TPA: bifunctional diaminohydroxyphosphoribosylaminopyrimidine deaminase/5-amino-6-(5-phosphoribosylamino)uracil reductase RibD [Verrucomicrobiales bacterium]|jgi:diaminohydroxyphosphoribosylaminopyrimidine deaminase/5-amino-6-(5-phosphoribosylamino)uracil reductase|nr:bifunctional diaminohydroxyphosphoribosylaminopyrimidine deaminase/5-amino-6-(5-phosphoribosylamino)uracil reductase RibD [Verrucomicrobiales bacterium]